MNKIQADELAIKFAAKYIENPNRPFHVHGEQVAIELADFIVTLSQRLEKEIESDVLASDIIDKS